MSNSSVLFPSLCLFLLCFSTTLAADSSVLFPSLCLFLPCFSTTLAADPVALLQFTMQWQPGKCSVPGITCKVKPAERFTMHGIWPASASLESIVYCKGSPLAKEQQLTNNVPDLKTYWPDVENGNDYNFWTREWNKHGKCSEQQLNQLDYFKLAGQILGKYNILEILKEEQIVPNNQMVEKTKVQQAIERGIGKAPKLNCKDKSAVAQAQQLVEVVLCLDNTGKTLIDCPDELDFRCPDMFVFTKVLKSNGKLKDLKQPVEANELSSAGIVSVKRKK